MSHNDLVVSLEWAKKLVKNGWNDKTIFVHREYNDWLVEFASNNTTDYGWDPSEVNELPAPSILELMLKLPDTLKITKIENSTVCIINFKNVTLSASILTLADSLAKIWITFNDEIKKETKC
jgi:hypothetical protein